MSLPISASPDEIRKLSGLVSRKLLISAMRASAASAADTIAETGTGVGEGVGLADEVLVFEFDSCPAEYGGKTITASKQAMQNKREYKERARFPGFLIFTVT